MERCDVLEWYGVGFEWCVVECWSGVGCCLGIERCGELSWSGVVWGVVLGWGGVVSCSFMGGILEWYSLRLGWSGVVCGATE